MKKSEPIKAMRRKNENMEGDVGAHVDGCHMKCDSRFSLGFLRGRHSTVFSYVKEALEKYEIPVLSDMCDFNDEKEKSKTNGTVKSKSFCLSFGPILFNAAETFPPFRIFLPSASISHSSHPFSFKCDL